MGQGGSTHTFRCQVNFGDYDDGRDGEGSSQGQVFFAGANESTRVGTDHQHGQIGAEIVKNDLDHRKWINPLESRLPAAKNMKIYCMYGIGHETERGYIYKPRNQENDQFTKESVDPRDLILPMSIDLQEEDRSKKLYKGIHHVDGDATVPLLSLSYMCTHAWRNFTHLNPSGIKVITREFKHAPTSRVTDLRGGPGTSDHVDILGNHDLTLDVLKIASNFEDASVNEDRIFSNIHEINSKVDLKFD